VLLICTPKAYVLPPHTIPERVLLLHGRQFINWLQPFASLFSFPRDPKLDDVGQKRFGEPGAASLPAKFFAQER